MTFFKTITDWIIAVIDAKNAGLTNDGGNLMTFFNAEYKRSAQDAYHYWLATNGSLYQK